MSLSDREIAGFWDELDALSTTPLLLGVDVEQALRQSRQLAIRAGIQTAFSGNAFLTGRQDDDPERDDFEPMKA